METTTLRRTSLHEAHLQAGAKMVPFAGYDMPVQYEGLKAEHEAVRTRCGMFDVSHMGEFLVEGPDALALIQWIGVTCHVWQNPMQVGLLALKRWRLFCLNSATCWKRLSSLI